MKKLYLLHILLLSCAIGGLSAASPALAEDNIERSCRAYYMMHMGAVENKASGQLFKILQVTDLSLEIPDLHPGYRPAYAFSARRGCGRTVPNRCRRRASEAAMQCMVAHAKAPGSTPVACTSNGVENYRITNLEKPIQEAVCKYVDLIRINRKIMPGPYSIVTTIKGVVDGDEGCGGGDRRKVEQDIGSIRIICP